MSKITFPGGAGGAGGGGGVTDHGGLAGLGDDDHTQYFLSDGSRSVSGNILPNTDIQHSIGNSGLHWGSGYFEKMYLGSGTPTPTGGVFDVSTPSLVIHSHSTSGQGTMFGFSDWTDSDRHEGNGWFAVSGGGEANIRGVLAHIRTGSPKNPSEGSGLIMSVAENENLYLRTNNVIKQTIDGVGNIGFHIMQPQYPMHVKGSGVFSSTVLASGHLESSGVQTTSSGVGKVGLPTVPFGSGYFNSIVLFDNVTGKQFSLTVDASGVLTTTAL